MKRIPTYAFIILAVLLTALILSACPTDGGGGGDGDSSITITNAAEWSAALNKINNGGNGKSYVLTIAGSFDVTPVPLGVYNLTITLKGNGTLSHSSSNTFPFFTLTSGNILDDGPPHLGTQTLIIDGDVTLSGGTSIGVALINVNGGSSLELKKGTITGNTVIPSSNYGAGVYVSGGSFTMSGGTISNNTANGNGGGVYVESATGSSFTMTGGTISNNTANGKGGGVYVVTPSSFSKSGGTISGNTASANTEGHAVFYNNYGPGYYRDTALGTSDDISTASDKLPSSGTDFNWTKK